MSRKGLFVFFDYATLRTTDLFVTDRDYKLLDVENTDIETVLDDTEESENKQGTSSPKADAAPQKPFFF